MSHEYNKNFELWWKAYPRKAGKRDAEKAWERACHRIAKYRGSLMLARDFLLERVKAFAESDKAMGEFCPHASTWLNQGRYDDDDAEWYDKPKEVESWKTAYQRVKAAARDADRFDAERTQRALSGLSVRERHVLQQMKLSSFWGDKPEPALMGEFRVLWEGSE